MNKDRNKKTDIPEHLAQYPLSYKECYEPIKPRNPIVVEDLDPTNIRKGEKALTFMIKLEFPDSKPDKGWGEFHIIGPDHQNELLINTFYQVSRNEYIFNVRLLNYEILEYFDNKYLKPGTEFFMFCSDNNR